MSPPLAHVTLRLLFLPASPAPVHRSVAGGVWLGTLASPSLGGGVTDADGGVVAADADVEARSSTELPAPTIPRAVVPDAADDDIDGSSSRAIVDAA